MENHPETDAVNKTESTLEIRSDASAGFTPPRHWVGPEELEASYWSNPQVLEKRAQEFHDKPVELIEKIDGTDTSGLARRDFLTIMGASMAMTTFACARRPVHKIIPYVIKPEEIVPGVANWYATTCKETGYGILVKNREGRPIKIEGNPDHPMNKGTLSARGQATILSLYDPDRLKAPIARSRGGAAREMNWADADTAIVAKLKAAKTVRVLSGEMRSPSTERLLREFLLAFAGNARGNAHVTYEPLALEEISEGQAQAYGAPLIPQYRFDEADLIVSLGADFLGTWLSPVEYSAQWSKKRKLDSANAAHAKLSKLVCFESMMTTTGANADLRVALHPGDEYKIALALAHEIIVQNGLSPLAGNGAIKAALEGYSAGAVASDLGIEGGIRVLRKLAEELWENKGRSLVVGGGIHAKTKDALALQVAVNLLNSALGNEGVTVDGSARFRTDKARLADFAALTQEMKSGSVDVLVLYRTNPAYSLSPALRAAFEDGLKKVPLVVSVSDYDDETALFADYSLPDHHFLENWGDASPRKGLHSLQQPAMGPMHSTRAFEDTLLAWSKAAGKQTGLMTRSADWHAYLQENWKESVYKQHRISGTFEQFWEGVLRQGVFDSYAAQGNDNPKTPARAFRNVALNAIPKFSRLNLKDGAVLALYESIQMHDGRCANNPWLQEMPDPISAITWDNFLNVSPQYAREHDLKENDVVEVASASAKAQLPVHVQPGLRRAVVTAAVGYGRRRAGKVGNGNGTDVYPLVEGTSNGQLFSGQPVTLRKTGEIYRLASTQLHTLTENRPIINDITLGEFRKNPATANHTDPHLRMETVPSIWGKHEYKGYRWGMAIDLNSCTGCSACMIGCQAENNIPVVGREQVRNSRQMHWIRIDRYYSGSVENPEMVFQPMLCQHCENAPCETVCPVLATVHDDEGVNVQVYNRCVGTRYCQNNCPYKVRRFNFFDHWKTYEGTMNLAWNPDVTVRTRGIMEKCTFCLQRVRDAKDKAKDEGVKVRDGDLKTACQQTCPTDAIVFGNVNDPGSRVSKLRADQRAFRALEIVNAGPMISYMTKVRNKAGGGHATAAHHDGGKG